MTVALQLLDGVRWQGQPITGERQQLLLAALAEAGTTGASAGRLAEEIWGDEPPADPARALQVVVSRTRSMTSPDAVLRTEVGYRLGLPESDVDHLTLLAATNRATLAAEAGDLPTALEAAEAAASIPVAERDDDTGLGRLAASARGLQETSARVAATALSRLGQHRAAVPRLQQALAKDPADEELVAALLRSLAATSGPASALARYELHRATLADSLGTDPGPELQRLHAELLAADRPVREGIRYDANTLLGRDSDLAALRALMSSGRVTSIVGAGGLGKTRLAHVLARTDSHPVVHFVELVGVTAPEDLIGEVGSALGVRDSVIGRRTLTPEQRADVRARMVQQLDSAPTLLVLDNCEHLVAAVADLVAYLVAGTRDLHVVTTTRAPLGIAAERVYLLGQLDTGYGVELFAQRALAARPSVVIDSDVAAELVTRLDGLPLAIELAAAKTRVMSVEEISRRLENRFALLRGGDRSAPDRHQTLLAVIDWSWNLLTEPQRSALRRLSVFHDGFALEAAEQVLEPGSDGIDVIQDLVDQSLLSVHESPGAVRYRMLETVREFGRMQLVDAGEDEGVQRAQRAWAAGYAARYAGQLFSPDQFTAVDALRAEESNLADVLRQSLAEPDPDTVVQILAGLASYWSIRGDHTRVIVLAEAIAQALEGWAPEPELEDLTRVALVVTFNNTMIGASDRAEPIRDLLRKLGPGDDTTDPRVAAMVTVVALAYDSVDADGFAERLATMGKAPDRYLSVMSQQWLSHVLENAGDAVGAVTAAESALELSSEDDGPWSTAILHTQLAQLDMQLGRTASAVQHAHAALPVLERLGARDDTLQLRSLFALSAILDGDVTRAEQEVARLSELDEQDSVFGGKLIAEMCRAELELARGDHAPGLARYVAAAERVRTMQFPGVPISGLEPWVLFAESVALTAYAYYGQDESADEGVGTELFVRCRDRGARVLDPTWPYLDFPVCGLVLFALGAWGLLRDTLPAVDALRLLALADRFAYSRMVPTMAWERIVPHAEAKAPGVLGSLLEEYADRRGAELLDETRRFVEELPG